MCFHFSINRPKELIEERFGSAFEPSGSFEPEAHANAFTKPLLPVVTNKAPDKIQLFKWGLIPHWVKDSIKANEISSGTFNARAETIHEKPSFRDAIKTQRCLILSDGFFEWKTQGKKKIRHFITLDNDELFAFAGIWGKWINKDTAEVIQTFSIITQEANPFMAKIHNIKKRQPVILNRETESEWLKGNYDLNRITSDSFNNKFKAVLN